MEQYLYQYIKSQSDLLLFLRQNPQWYRELTRNPNQIQQLEKEAKAYFGKTVPQRIERLSSQMQMISMLLQMAGAMKD